MIKIAICDDCKKDLLCLDDLCRKCNLNDSIRVDLYNDGEKLLLHLNKNSFDIVLLDVDMPKLNGISLGKQIRMIDQNIIIIFCTSYPQYAIEAFDCEAFSYLLKPCTAEKVQEILLRATKKLGMIHKYHIIKIQNKTLRLPISEIYYIEYCQKHIIYHSSTKKYETTGKFFEVYNELKKYGFYQVHQGYIVNLSKVKDFNGYTVILDNDQKVLISVRKKRDVLLAYTKYVEELS